MIRRHLWSRLGGLVTVLTGMLAGCSPPAPPMTETPPPPITVSQPLVRQVVDFDHYEGHIGALKLVEVRSRVRGHLMKIYFQDGAIVKKGDLLYEIDPRPAKAELDAAKAQESAADASLEFAKAEYNRTRILYAKGATSREELETWIAKQAVAKGELLKAKAAVERAELQLKYTQIRAEIDGKLSRTQVDEGNLVNAGGGETLLTTLVSIDPIYVYFDVDERSMIGYRNKYRKESNPNSPEPPVKDLHIPVYVALEGEEGYPHSGEVDFADNQVKAGTGTVEVRGILSNARRIFNHNNRARVRVPIGDPHKVVLVTERAIANEQAKKFVYVIDEQNTVQRHDVELGRLFDGLQAIQQGLRPDEWVIVNGIQRVREGKKAKPNRIAMPGVKQEQSTTK